MHVVWGLQILHYGYIIINQYTHIGKNLTIYPGVEIGHKVQGGKCPIIGSDCFIGAGAKIFGDIHIGDNVTIAENLVILKNMVIGGLFGSTIIMMCCQTYNMFD